MKSFGWNLPLNPSSTLLDAWSTVCKYGLSSQPDRSRPSTTWTWRHTAKETPFSSEASTLQWSEGCRQLNWLQQNLNQAFLVSLRSRSIQGVESDEYSRCCLQVSMVASLSCGKRWSAGRRAGYPVSLSRAQSTIVQTQASMNQQPCSRRKIQWLRLQESHTIQALHSITSLSPKLGNDKNLQQ